MPAKTSPASAPNDQKAILSSPSGFFAFFSAKIRQRVANSAPMTVKVPKMMSKILSGRRVSFQLIAKKSAVCVPGIQLSPPDITPSALEILIGHQKVSAPSAWLQSSKTFRSLQEGRMNLGVSFRNGICQQKTNLTGEGSGGGDREGREDFRGAEPQLCAVPLREA